MKIDDSIIDFANAKGLDVTVVAPFISKIRKLREVKEKEVDINKHLKERFLSINDDTIEKEKLKKSLIKSHANIEKTNILLQKTTNKFESLLNFEDNEI